MTPEETAEAKRSVEEKAARLAERAAEARRQLETAAAAGDPEAIRILAELDGTAEVILVNPKPVPHWADGRDQ
jgi:hypothetical protein